MSERKTKSIFLEAVEKYSPDEWDNYLDEVCQDGETRRRVELLLHAHQISFSITFQVPETKLYLYILFLSRIPGDRGVKPFLRIVEMLILLGR